MKRWIPLLAVALLMSAAPAFAQSCAYCIYPLEGPACMYDATIGGIDCRIYYDTGWCEELGWCNYWCPECFASKSVTTDWKVAQVRVLTPNTSGTPGRIDTTAIALARNNEARALRR